MFFIIISFLFSHTVVHLLRNANQLVTFAENEGWTPLHYAAYHELDFTLGLFIDAQKVHRHPFVYRNMVSTPLHVAAENGYTSTLIQLLTLWPSSSSAYTAVNKSGQNILHLAATQNKKEMILGIIEYCPVKCKDEILKQQDAKGNTPLHLLFCNGCFIPKVIKHKGLDTMANNKDKWTPSDMLYFHDEIVADQVQIRIALDEIQTNQWWMFWQKNMVKKTNILASVVLPSKRERKDELFNEKRRQLKDVQRLRMKQDLERYKNRTNTQIIVTALITTVTFTVGFTMPGGLHQSGERNKNEKMIEGLVILSKEKAFNAFMVSDAVALLLSTCSLFLYFLESMCEDLRQVSKLNATSTGLNIVSVISMMLTFIAGTYVVLYHSQVLSITVCIISSFFFLFVIVLMIKMVYDCQVKSNED